jgi:hypothetical protein
MISVRPAAPAKSAPKVYDKWYRNEALYGNPLGEVFRTCWSATWRLHRPVRLHRVDAACAACDHISSSHYGQGTGYTTLGPPFRRFRMI